MAKKQELNLGGLMMGVTTRLSGAMEEVETAVAPAEETVKNEPEQPEVVATPENEAPAVQDPNVNAAATAEPEPVAENEPEQPEIPQLELSIDEDINMYAGITKAVSFALPKEIKRSLDNFVDEYNDARPTNKTTQAKVVAQALRNFLKDYL